MLNTWSNQSMWGARLRNALAALALAGCGSAALAASFDLCATTGTAAAPVGVAVYGYAAGACTPTTTVAAPGGPTLVVNVGEAVTVNLSSNLPQNTGLLFQGQSMVPDTTGTPSTATKSYTFTATSPGTYLYEAAPLTGAEFQVPMGLYGALVVLPAPSVRADASTTVTAGSAVVADAAALATDLGSAVSGTGIPANAVVVSVSPGVSFTLNMPADAAGDGTVTLTRTSAYADAASTYNDEAVLLLSEIDPALNTSANPAAFDMRTFAPKFFLINGVPYPDTFPVYSESGRRVMLRYVNAGAKHHSMALLGVRQVFVAKDGSLLPTANHTVVAETLAPGQTGDALVTIPAVSTQTSFALYDASLMLHNNNAPGFGGMLTFVVAQSIPGGDTNGPITGPLTLTSTTVSASISDVTTGNANVTAAEYFVDTTGSSGSGTAMTGTFGTPTVNVSATFASALTGNRTVYVHGRDSAGNWGPLRSATINNDTTGPATSGLTLTPNPSNGTVNVALHATGNDTATGGSNVNAAEYFKTAVACTPATCPAGTGTAMTVNVVAPTASLDATILAPVTAGVVSVHARDSQGNWGPFATITLSVVGSGPVTSAVSAAPNPNNGALPLNSSQPVVRVTATMTSTASTVSGAEGFLCTTPALNCTVGATGTGFPLVPSDGGWNQATETGYADIPLSTINALSTGSHTIYVRGRDATGNWGATTPMTLVIDRTNPTATSASLSPPASNNAPVTINAIGADTACAPANCVIGGGEYYVDAVGAAGSGAPMAATSATAFSATIPTATLQPLATGNHTIYVRARDAAGNWSSNTVSATLLIDRTAPTFSGITLTPNSIASGGSVSLALNGASDGAGGSGVAGGEWWIGSTNITAGTGTAFTGLSTTIPTASLGACTYTVRTRIQDVATNWSTGNNGVRTATLTVTGTPADPIFSDGFEGGNTNAWTSRSTNNNTRLNVTAAAALVGTNGLQAQGSNTNYVQYDFGTCPPAAATFDARFYFRPNGNSSTGKDIFVAASNSNFSNANTLFRVRYRLNAGTPQVQIQVGTGNTNAAWTNINGGTSNNVIEVVRGTGGSLTLYVNSTLSQTLTASTTSVSAVRLGSVTSTGNATAMYFDAFASKRSVTPLIGP